MSGERMRARVRTGLDRLLNEGSRQLRGRRIGWLINPSSVDGTGVPSLLRLQAAGLRPAALFGPEHGLWGAAQDMIAVEGEREPLTDLPVHSLYGHDESSLRPDPDALRGLDALVFDVQDIGTRYYTYAYTLLLAMQACAEAGVPVIVCDRPNPLGGERIEGGAVQEGFRSFVGMHSLPVRHGLTIGELALLFRAELQIDVDLEVLWCEGWSGDMLFADTGLVWVMPSPNMPTFDTSLVYPGQCLLEGTSWSEGRGTTRPFELFGAPGVDPFRYAAEVQRHWGEAALARPVYFHPMFQKHAGRTCGGVFLHVRTPRNFDSLATGVAALTTAWSTSRSSFGWREQAYEFVSDRLAIDLLFGSDAPRLAIESGAGPRDVLALFEPDRQRFIERRMPYLHHPRPHASV